MTAYGMSACSRRERVRGEIPAPVNNGNNSTKGVNPNRKSFLPEWGLWHRASSTIHGKKIIAKYPKAKPRTRTEIRRRQTLWKRTILIGTWNTQGLAKKMAEIINEVKRINMDIVVLTETKKKGNGIENLDPYIHIYSGVHKAERAKLGVSILIHKKFKKFIYNWEAISERLIKVDMCVYGYRTTILGVYALNNDAPVGHKDEFFEQLDESLKNIGATREIFILGDMNSRTGKKRNDPVVGFYGEDVLNDNGGRLINVCEQNDMKISNGFFQHKWIHKFTWTQETRNIKSIIDYVIVKQNTKLIIQDVKVARGVTCGSDHYLLKAKIIFPGNKGSTASHETKPSSGKLTSAEEQYNLRSLEDDSTRLLYNKRLDEKLEQRKSENSQNQYEHIMGSIHQAALEALGREEKKHRRPQPYWWNEIVANLIEQKRVKYLRFLNTKDYQDRVIYKEAQAKVRKKITECKNEMWEASCKKIDTYIGGRRSTECWKFIKGLRTNSKKQNITSITENDWEKHYRELLTESRNEYKQDIKDDLVILIGSPLTIDVETVKKACQKLKNNKAPGPGGIPSELIKYGSDKLHIMLKDMFQTCLAGGQIPEDWKVAYISNIHKKGDKNNCDNYRGISVTSTLSRLYGRILKEKIENEYRDMEAEEQAGFRAGRSTIDNVFCLTQLIEKKTAVNQELHILFVDLSKAYDSIPLVKLWEALEQTNISVCTIQAIKRLYEGSRSKIKIGNTLTEGFPVNKGLRQGCCLSPSLFKIYLEHTLKKWKKKCQTMGIELERGMLYTLNFADDQLIIAQDYHDLEYMTRKLIEEYSSGGLEINIQKTKYMCIGGTQQTLELENGLQIKGCTEYTYLGVKISNDGICDAEIKSRNLQGRKAISMLNAILWDQTISKQSKTRIYNTIVKSIVSYGSEVWQLRSRCCRILEATEMDFWRRAAGRSRVEKIKNEKIREVMNVKHTIVDEIKTKQLVWFGHVQRMGEDRLPKKILYWKPPGRRKRGRPRTSWREGIDNEITTRGLEQDQWLDREAWREGLGRRRRTL